MRLPTHRFALWLLAFLASGIALAFLSEWLLQVGHDKGLFDDAGEQWDRAMNAIIGGLSVATDFLSSGWALYPLALLVGFVGGLWLDRLLKAKETPHAQEEKNRKTAGIVDLRANQSLIRDEDKQPIVPESLYIHGKRHQDGVDITPIVVIRNRSTVTMQMGKFQWNYVLIDEKRKTRKGVTVPNALTKEKSHSVRLSGIRFYTLPDVRPIEASVTFVFGRTKQEMQKRISFHYEGKLPNPLPEGDVFRADLVDLKLVSCVYSEEKETPATPEIQNGIR